MKKRIIAFVCVLALLLGTPIASVEAASANTYQVGFSKVDVTPDVDAEGYENAEKKGIPLGGYGDQSTRLAVGVLTPEILQDSLENSTEFASQASALDAVLDDEDMFHLFASCVAITDENDTTLLMLSLDVIGCSDSRSASMRKAITKATGVPDENITITSTHTHSGPDLSQTAYDQTADYVAAMDEKIALCAVEAMANRSPATMLQNTVDVDGYNVVRHYYTSTKANPLLDDADQRHVTGSNFGSQYGTAVESVKEADNDMHLLMFDFADSSKNDVVLCNWRAHPCRDSSSTMYSHTVADSVYFRISSDYIGPMRAAVEDAGYDLLFLQGAAGNIAAASSADKTSKRSSFTYGTELAQHLLTGLSDMQKLDAGFIQTSRTNMTAAYNQSNPADVPYAQKVQDVYKDMLDGDNKITDENLLNWVKTVYYTEKTTSGSTKVSVYGESTTNPATNTYLRVIRDGVINQTEAHAIANRLAWAGGYGSRYHINNIVTNAGNTGSGSLQINAITLGSDIAFVTAPNEIFDSYTEDLKDYYGKRTFVMGYTNGSNGYLPDEQAFHYNATQKDDGTWVYGGSYEVHTTDYVVGTGERVAQTMKALLDDMHIRTYCPCVGNHTDSSDCKELKWEPWTSTTTLPTSGNYYLTKNITVSGSTELLGTLNLDLNGKTVQGKNGIFTMARGDHLVVTDSYTGGQLGVSGIPIVANSGSNLTVYAGAIGGTVKDNGANVALWGTPSLYINMAKNAPAMDCEGLQTGAYVYVVGTLDQCFAKVSSAAQKACFTLQNDYNSRYEDGSLYLTSKQYHCVCNGTLDGQDTDHVCELVSWQPWTATDSLPTATGNYYLTSAVYLDSEQVIEDGATVRLDLNGKTVYVGQVLDADGNRVVSDTGIRAFYIPNGSTLELCSSTTGGTGTLEGVACAPTTRSKYGGVIYADNGSTLNLYNNIKINGNRYTSTSSASAYKRTATAVRGGCVYSLGSMTVYGGTITNGSVVGSGKAGGNVYTNGSFAMYGGKITSGVGTGINLYIDKNASATIGGNSYIYSGVVVNGEGKLTLKGAPHIPTYVYSTGSVAGINVSASCVIDATGLDAQAMAQTAPNADTIHCINVKASGTNTFAKVNTASQASFFESYTDGYGVHCDANGNVSLYDIATGNRYGCICGGKLEGSSDHTCSVLTWKPWTSTNSLPTEGNYYLTSNVAVTSNTEVNGELNLDLHGCTVTATGSSRVYDIGSGETLRITDSRSGGTIDATAITGSADGGVVYVSTGTFELYDGILLGGDTFVNGGVIFATADSGKQSTVNMYEGTITGTATQYGGGMYLYRTSFTMYGGTITSCSAGRGGSIYLGNSAVAIIKDGSITDGTATSWTSGSTFNNARGGNIHLYASTSSLTVEGGEISGGRTLNSNGNGGNICMTSGTVNIHGGTISYGNTVNQGGNIAVMGTESHLYMTGGEVCNPISSTSIAMWGTCTAEISGGKIYGASTGITNNKGTLILKKNAYIYGNTSSNISMTEVYKVDDNGNYVDRGTDYALGTLTVDPSFVGTASVKWGSITTEVEGIAPGAALPNTVSTGYADTGTLLWASEELPITNKDGQLYIATVGIADGDGSVSHHADLADALENYELENTADQKFIQLYTDQTDAAITESIYLDLNGYDMSVSSVADGCSIYGMDSATNQYTHYAFDGADLCGKLTLAEGIADTCIVKDVHISLTKGATKGTRKYLALTADGSYTFHRYYLSLTEVGLRPADAGIFYNAVFYGDEAVANAVTKYGVEVSTVDTFAAGSTASSDYQNTLGVFKSGVLGNQGYRTVLKGILSENGVTPVVDYSKEDIYGRAYIEVDGITLYCSDIGSTNLQSIVASADTSYGKNAFSSAQKAALDTMYNKYSKIMESWNILRNIGRIEIDIGDLFIKDPRNDDELNILLIGNSFSFYWVEELYELLAEGSGYAPEKINITNVYYSGCPLKNHWNWLETGAANYNIAVTTKGGRAYDKTVFEDLETVITGSRAKSWDFISLQQNSGAFYAGDYVGDLNYARQTLEPYLGNLLSYLRSKHPKAQYMWHQFWSHEVGHESTSGSVTVNNVEERTAFHDAMVAIGNEVSQLYNMTVVPTGEAWELVRDDSRIKIPYSSTDSTLRTLCTRSNSSGTLYDDLYHDGDVGGGQYLNACVWYEKITGKSVLDLTWKPTYEFSGKNYDLTDEQVALLKYAAHAAVAKYTPNGDPSQDNETNILLIGNSFSYHWTDELAGMLTAAGYPNVSIYNVYESGCDLQAHWTGYQAAATSNDGNDFEFRLNNSTVETGLTLFECITRKNWDMISLQQSGSYVYGSTGSLEKFVTNSDPYVKNLLSTLRGMFPQAEYYWLQNWAHEIYEEGTHSDTTGISTLADRQRIAGIFRDGANEMCAKYSLTNVPCGDAWELVRDNSLVNYGTYDLTSRARPSTTMLTDGRHDGDYCGGQYLNACVWFETITGTSCLDNTFVPSYNNKGTVGYLTNPQINLLKQGAHDAVAAVYGENYAK